MYRTKKPKMTKLVTIQEPDIPPGWQLIESNHINVNGTAIDNRRGIIYINPADRQQLPMREKTITLPRSFTFKGVKK